MKQRTFIRDFTHDIDESTRKTFPEGWSGEVDDDIAAAADDAGATDKPAKSGKGGKAKADPADAAAADDAGATDAPAADAPPA